LIPDLIETARAAARAILEHYHPEVERWDKDDKSPVTAADHASEAIIERALVAIDPAVPVVAEEAFAAGRIPDVSRGRFWLVDPLDGTKEFLKANGEFCINIGLVEERRPILGLIHAPVSGETFWGYGGQAFMQAKGGQKVQAIRTRLAPEAGLVVLASRSHGNRDDLKGFLADKKVQEVRISGSAMKFCRLAQGVGDLYPRLGPTMEWDSCAGHAILDAAGGSVTTLDGGPFLYAKPGFRNTPFVARGRAS
jgi:3'(2'), 5'-bisphosphate nucleotidase